MNSVGVIFKKISLIMAEVGHVAKSRKNAQQGYSFRGIDDVYAAVQLVLAKHGVFVVPSVIDDVWGERQSKSGGTMMHLRSKISHTFFAEDGSSVTAVTLGEAMDSGDKCSNKAMSAAMKYALLEVLCIPTDEAKDPEEDSPVVTGLPMAAVERFHGDRKPDVKGPADIAAAANPGLVPWYVKNPLRLKVLNAVITELDVGKGEADIKGLTGAERATFIRKARLDYVSGIVGRKIESSHDLTSDEVNKVTDAAKAGVVPSSGEANRVRIAPKNTPGDAK